MDVPHLPDYELLAEIGGNSLTRLFAARHRAGGFDCVVKTIRDDIHCRHLATQAVKNEARIGLAARHRNVIRVYDAQVHVAPCYVILECIEGESLQVRLQAGPLDWAATLAIARQIAEALMAIHRLGHVHGNVNPSSVLIKAGPSVVLAELGNAHRPGDTGAMTCNPGSSIYVPPEFREDVNQHTFASDWYSFGVTLSELLTGESSVLTDQPNDILRFRDRAALERWAKRRALPIPPALVELASRTTDENPKQRPMGSEIIQQLMQLEAAESVVRLAA